MHRPDKKLQRFGMLALILTSLLGLAACSDDSEPIVDPPSLPEFPNTPEILIYKFKDAYEDMSLDDLESLLADDFQMIPSYLTRLMWGWDAGDVFDRATFVAIHDHMFSGLPGQDSNENTVHPIATIEVDLLEQMIGWEVIPEEDEYFGGMEGEYAPFRVTIQFHDADLTHRYLVQQQVNFYVQSIQVDGSTAWQLLGLQGAYLKTDETTWDSVCALYQ